VVWSGRLDILLKIGKAQFICIFVLAVVLGVFLDGIVGEMDHSVLEVFGCEFLGGCADVALLVPVGSEVAIEGGHQDVAAEVELALVIEEGHEVALHYVGTRLAVGSEPLRLHDLPHFLDSLYNVDPAALVGVLSGFDDPQTLLGGLTGHEVVPLVVTFLLDVVGLGDVLEGILASGLIIGLHIVVECLFVTEIPVEFQMVVGSQFGCFQSLVLLWKVNIGRDW
jgi:hypothetical protein